MQLTPKKLQKFLDNYTISINAGTFNLDYLLDTEILSKEICKLQKEKKNDKSNNK